MVKIYLDKLIDLMDRIKLDERYVVKHFFSGAAVYVDGKICITLTPKGLAFKLPLKERDRLLKLKGFRRLRYFPKAPVKKEYVVLNGDKINNIVLVRRLVKVSVGYVGK